MSLKDITIKKHYDSDEDDILNEFYIKVLSESVTYERLAGFFSSSTLVAACQGIYKFVKENNGKIKIITSACFSDKDIEAIKIGLKDRNQTLTDNFIKDWDLIKDDFINDHFKALSWLIANNRLIIKVAIFEDENGMPVGREDTRLFHQKVGILTDNEGNKLSFSGSENESYQGWSSNIEEFKVFRGWMEDESDYLLADIYKFDKFWNNNAQKIKIINIPDAIKEKFIQKAPKEFEDSNINRWYNLIKDKKSISLRYFQNEAIKISFIY